MILINVLNSITALVLLTPGWGTLHFHSQNPFYEKMGSYRIKKSDKDKIHNLKDLTMVIDLPQNGKPAPIVDLDFVHTNGSKYHVGPMNPTASSRNSQQLPRKLEDHLRGVCWGLRQSTAGSVRRMRVSTAETSHAAADSVFERMIKVSRVFASDLSECKVGNTVICPEKGGSIILGFSKRNARSKIYTRSDFLFVTMEPTQIESASSTISKLPNRPDREGPVPPSSAAGKEPDTPPVAQGVRVDPQPSTIGKRQEASRSGASDGGAAEGSSCGVVAARVVG
ncbi:hypothetical protein FOL46_007553 [Perkinsus olseni]|uniref:Uncharacterized protein n=1 Tax=Perkinsus olseni TaxID=32597 RepID=A0A7J6MP41_PEROL|nr:hypothetical protein FOL46_007553 [Perkinsus olseni]